MYLELGSQLSYNGGELIYVCGDLADFLFRAGLTTQHQLDNLLKPGLLWALCFSSFFILIANTTGNALAFARFIMVAATPDYRPGDDLDARVVKLIAIDILSIVCLLHYFSSRLGLLLNKVLALYKLALLIAVFSASAWAAQHLPGLHTMTREQGQPSETALSKLAALVLVLYSFTGWENANYVGSDIPLTSTADKTPGCR